MIQLELTTSHLEAMQSHVEACLPEEACGLLAGRDWVVEEVIPVENAARSTVRFRMDPRQQLAALERIDAAGLDLLGIFHSHPQGPEAPSATDIAEAAYPVVYLIWFRRQNAWEVRGFWLDESRVSEVKLYAAGA
jgi:[CysO sulfur-carrier protein]-S-L-cysteine hydrolase